MQATRGATRTAVKPYDLDTRKTIDGELNERAIRFMERHFREKKAFFAYIPYTQAHVPPTAHPDFEGTTGSASMKTAMSTSRDAPSDSPRWVVK